MKNVNSSARLTSFVLTISFLVGLLIVKLPMMQSHSQDTLTRIWFCCCIFPIFGIVLFQNKKFRPREIFLKPFCWSRIRTKYIIVLLQLFAIVLVNFIFLQLNLVNYGIFFEDVFVFLPILLVIFFAYTAITDNYLEYPNDEYYQLGCMLNRTLSVDKTLLRSFMLKTGVKIIFIPYMYSSLMNLMAILINMDLNFSPDNLNQILFNFGITLDVLIGTMGYLLSAKLINNDIKDTDSHILGWIFTLLCYPPLLILRENINKQTDALLWTDILPRDSFVYWVYFVLINSTWVVYWLATFEFGITFSNLSWRRLINTGVYKYTKHPAYIAKNIFWWLNTLPFIGTVVFSQNWWHNILALTSTSLLYYARAWSEERHLKKFPEYVAYAQTIQKHGIFRWLRFPRKRRTV